MIAARDPSLLAARRFRMTTTSPGHLATLHTTVSGELLDGLVEALALPADPRARSAVICAVVQQMCSTVECLGSTETGQGTEQELMSMRQLARAAFDHRLRMTFFAPVWETESR
jgi:hypothetical protein